MIESNKRELMKGIKNPETMRLVEDFQKETITSEKNE